MLLCTVLVRHSHILSQGGEGVATPDSTAAAPCRIFIPPHHFADYPSELLLLVPIVL